MQERTFSLVQPILVPRHGTHAQIITAVAQASYLAYTRAPEAPGWAEWLRTPAKSVRKVKSTSHLERLLGELRTEEIPVVVHNGVLALPPMTYEQMPRLARQAQVQGVTFPSEASFEATDPAYEIAVLQGLSTGKAAAQAAHATWLWHHKSPGFDPGATFQLRFVTGEELSTIAARDAGLAVHDAGFTEVTPGTLTAVATELSPTQ